MLPSGRSNKRFKKHCIADSAAHFFLPPAFSPSFFASHEITFPSITTPLPSINATRERPSQFLNVSHTSGCCGWKLHWPFRSTSKSADLPFFCHLFLCPSS